MTSKAISRTTTAHATGRPTAITGATSADVSTDASASDGRALPVPTGIQSKDQSGTQSEGPWSRGLVKEIAMDIGKEIVAYIEVMYPEAIKATSSTFKLAVRNSIYNQIMAAIEVNDAGQIQARLRDRKTFRREWTAQYRKIRKAKIANPDQPA